MKSFKAIQSNYNDKYVRYIDENPQLLGHLQASETNPDNTYYAQLKGQQSETQPDMVNVKSIYPDKYWVPKLNLNMMIAAESDTINEDLASPECTLFEILPVDVTTVRIRHANLDQHLCLFKATPSYDNCLALFPLDQIPPGKDLFTLIYDGQPK